MLLEVHETIRQQWSSNSLPVLQAHEEERLVFFCGAGISYYTGLPGFRDRRRRWSEEEKLKIVLESVQAPRQVSATARRYGLSRSQLLQWRRSFRVEQKDAAEQQIGLMPAGSAGGGSIEIKFASGARMRITGAVDQATLTAAVAALVGGRQR